MTVATDWITAFASLAAAVAAGVAARGVFFARDQLRMTREVAQLQFEDTLDREYRELAGRLPKNALLGEELSDAEYSEAFDELFCYIDLSNQQVSLWQRGRISEAVWESWCLGIRSNMAMPAFRRAWLEIKARSSNFAELRELEANEYVAKSVRSSAT